MVDHDSFNSRRAKYKQIRFDKIQNGGGERKMSEEM